MLTRTGQSYCTVCNVSVIYLIFRAIQNYAERYQTGAGGFEIDAFFRAMRDFVGIFSVSLFIGATMGCITALISFAAMSRVNKKMWKSINWKRRWKLSFARWENKVNCNAFTLKPKYILILLTGTRQIGPWIFYAQLRFIMLTCLLQWVVSIRK